MGFLKEFKEFALKSNVIDLASAVIIGAALGKIITSMVSDILMPSVGMLIGKVDLKELKFVMKEAVGDIPAVSLNYGMFIQTVIDFIIIAFCVFIVVKAYRKANRKEEEKPKPEPEPTNQEKLLTEIRDLLKKNS